MRGGYGVNYNTSQYGTFSLFASPASRSSPTLQTNIANPNYTVAPHTAGCGQYLTWSGATSANTTPDFNCSAGGERQ